MNKKKIEFLKKEIDDVEGRLWDTNQRLNLLFKSFRAMVKLMKKNLRNDL